MAESLSPSPFKNEDPIKSEAQLEHLVASAPCTTKSIIFFPFYGAEMMGKEGYRVWKIALKDHIVHTLESICLIKNLNPVPIHIIEKKNLVVNSLDPSICLYNWLEKKLLVFDLDETLVHCITDNIEKADKTITVTLNTGDTINAGVNIRPYAVECLKELKEHYNLIVFTASHPYYANTVIDILDPDKTLFSARLFRESCIKTDIGLFIKDLRVLNCNLNSTLIIDNSIISFAFQLDNGVPIIPFYDDKEDKIMPKIRDYLISLKDLDDVRTINTKTFSLTELYELDISSFLKYYYDDSKPEDFKDIDEEVDKNEVKKFSSFKNDSFKIGKKTQEVVNDHLGKFKQSLSKYLANQEKNKDFFANNENK